MRIIVDVDNVLNNLCEAVLEVYNEDANDNLTKEQIQSYFIEDFVKLEYRKTLKNYFLDKRVWKKIELKENCQEYLAKLYNSGHQIVFCTATEPDNFKKKANWLQRNFPFIDIRKSLFCCPIKQILRGDILIDDYIRNFGGTTYSICLAEPWNQHFLTDKKRFRVNNWKEIYEIIKKIEKEN